MICALTRFALVDWLICLLFGIDSVDNVVVCVCFGWLVCIVVYDLVFVGILSSGFGLVLPAVVWWGGVSW